MSKLSIYVSNKYLSQGGIMAECQTPHSPQMASSRPYRDTRRREGGGGVYLEESMVQAPPFHQTTATLSQFFSFALFRYSRGYSLELRCTYLHKPSTHVSRSS